MRTFLAAAALAALAAAGCGWGLSPQEREVKRTVSRTKTLIEETALNQATASSLATTLDLGGSLSTFFTARVRDPKGTAAFADGPQAYSVWAHPGAIPGELVIEGFGRATDKPLFVDHAKASPPRRRGGS